MANFIPHPQNRASCHAMWDFRIQDKICHIPILQQVSEEPTIEDSVPDARVLQEMRYWGWSLKGCSGKHNINLHGELPADGISVHQQADSCDAALHAACQCPHVKHFLWLVSCLVAPLVAWMYGRFTIYDVIYMLIVINIMSVGGLRVFSSLFPHSWLLAIM